MFLDCPPAAVAHRLGCSTISFRRLPLPDALGVIAGLGFAEVDLGAIPAVCDHVPVPLTAAEVDALADVVWTSGLHVRAVNADPGPMSRPGADVADLRPFAELARLVGAEALLLPAGADDRRPTVALDDDLALLAEGLVDARRECARAGIDLLVEAPHHHRLVHDLDRTAALLDALDGTDVGTVLDVSHVVAGGEDPADAIALMGSRLRHVHLRDAVPGDINRSIGRGDVDFPRVFDALEAREYDGHFSLELETHDVTDAERPAEAERAGRWITDLLRNRQGN